MRWKIFSLLMAGLVLAAGAASAYMGFADSASRDRIQDALEAKDYDAWKEAMMEGLTEERFNQAVERHAEHAERFEQMDAAAEALQANDYEAYAQALTEMGVDSGRIPSEEDFATLVELRAEHPGAGLMIGRTEGMGRTESRGMHSMARTGFAS